MKNSRNNCLNFIILSFFLLFAGSLSAQEQRWTKRVELSQNFTKWQDYLQTFDPQEGWILKDIWVSTFTFSLSSGFRINEYLESGIAVGIDYNDKQIFTSLPISVYLKYNFSNSENGHYFAEMRGGYGPGFLHSKNTESLKQSLQMSFIGIDLGKYFAFRKSNGISLALAYRIQQDKHIVENNNPWFSNILENTYLRNQICIKIAFNF